VHVDPKLLGDADKVIVQGIKNVGMYHSKRTLLRNKKGDVTTEDMNTLFYYHNRLVGYDLEKHI
jgi:glycerol-3-phosphate O-acyltransferase